MGEGTTAGILERGREASDRSPTDSVFPVRPARGESGVRSVACPVVDDEDAARRPAAEGDCLPARQWRRQPRSSAGSSAGSSGTRSASASRLVSAAMPTMASSSPRIASVIPLARAEAVWLAVQ